MNNTTTTPDHAAKHRLDIQGLRALAVLLVVAYHAGLPFVSGGFIGVDLFFVLSGFLIIGLLTAELERSGRIDLSRFWARRARRLVPASVIVIAATVWLSSIVVPFFDRKPIATDGLWALFFGANWRFAQQETDYLANDRDPSPLLHFWSLGVEEQFYFVVPFLFVIAGFWMAFRTKRANKHYRRRGQAAPRGFLTIVLTVVIVASLSWSVIQSASNQPYAFFGTPARAWQLAAGGLLAVLLPRLPRITTAVASMLAVAGLGLFASCAVMLSEGGTMFGYSYPSFLALGPTIAGVLLIASGSGASTVFTWLLSRKPLTYIGDISYSLYLWHWPALILGAHYLDDNRLGSRLLFVCAAFVAAAATYELVENPVRHARWLSQKAHPVLSVALAAGMIAAVIPLTSSVSNQSFEADASQASASTPSDDGKSRDKDEDSPAEPVDDSVAGLNPSLETVKDDHPDLYDRGCQVGYGRSAVPPAAQCMGGNENSQREVIVMGDSIAAAVTPAVIEAVGERWSVLSWSKSSCVLGDFDVKRPEGRGGLWDECRTWREAMFQQTLARKPDVVVMANSAGSYERIMVDGKEPKGKERDDAVFAGMKRTIRLFEDAGIKVVLVESPHRAPEDMPNCLADKQSVSACSFKAKDEGKYASRVADATGIVFIQPNKRVCPDGVCLPVVNRTITYRDALHYTVTYSKSLGGMFRDAIAQAVRS